jgi:preprotein translocase subunit YajC
MNNSWMSSWDGILVLAQDQAQPQAGAATPAQAVNPVGVPGATQGVTGAPSGGSQPLPAASTGSGNSPNMILWLFPIIAVLFLTTMMTGRKDKKKKAEMMSSLKKQDKVQMIGGEIGTIAEISDDEVVLRVEEGRIRFARSAVQAVLVPKNKPESAMISELKGEAKTTSV